MIFLFILVLFDNFSIFLHYFPVFIDILHKYDIIFFIGGGKMQHKTSSSFFVKYGSVYASPVDPEATSQLLQTYLC